MQIAMSKTREQFPLSRKKIVKKTIEGTILWVILFLLIYGVFVFIAYILSNATANISNPDAETTSLLTTFNTWFNLVTISMFVLLFLIILIQFLYQQWYFAVYFYDLSTDYIVIRKGPILPKEITIPYERIQDVYVDQDILDRMFGLYDVHLSSATISSGTQAHIDGVEKPAADGLCAALLDIVHKRISKNRNPQPQQVNRPS